MRYRISAIAGFVAVLIHGASAQTQDAQPPKAERPKAEAPAAQRPDAEPPNGADQPIPPGGIRVTTRPPDPGKWDTVPTQKGAPRVFNCKPLACADASRVIIVLLRSPTRNPDPEALEKYAKEDLPKSIRAGSAAQEILSDGDNKFETLSGKTAKLKSYPAVLNETKLTAGKKVIFIDMAIIFAGPLMMRVTSTSPNRNVAQKSLNEFVEATVIAEGPPLPITPGAQPTPVPLTPSKPAPSRPATPGDKTQSL